MRNANLGPLVALKMQGGGKVDTTKRALLGLLGRQQPSQSQPLAVVTPQPVQQTVSPLQAVAEKVMQTPMTRREFMEKTGKTIGSQAVQDMTGGLGLGSILKDAAQAAIKPVISAEVPAGISPKLFAVENGIKDWSIDSILGLTEGPDEGEIISWASTWLPSIQSKLSKNQIGAIKNAEKIAKKYKFDVDEIPKNKLETYYDGLEEFMDAVQANRDAIKKDVPTDVFVYNAGRYLNDNEMISLHDLMHNLDDRNMPPELVKELKNTEWAKELIHDIDDKAYLEGLKYED